jgi:hypothetical protein
MCTTCLKSPIHCLLHCDDTKCYDAIRTTDDIKDLQCRLYGIWMEWCVMWRMNLNETKCGGLKITRNLKPVQSSYHLNNGNSANSIVCKWNQQVSAVCAVANSMFVKRSTLTCIIFVHIPHFIKCSYKVASDTALASLVSAVCVFNPRNREGSKMCSKIHPIVAV